MTTETNTETATQLVHKYNGLVARAAAAGMTGYRELRVFHDKPTALARIDQLESALRARESGERAEEKRKEDIPEQVDLEDYPGVKKNQPPGRSRMLADPRAEKARRQTLADQEEALSMAKKSKRATRKTRENGNGEHKWAAQHKIIAKLLGRQKGCTREEVLAATGWKTVSVAMQAKMIGIELRKERTEEGLRYYAA